MESAYQDGCYDRSYKTTIEKVKKYNLMDIPTF
jgi:hypothetical protein